MLVHRLRRWPNIEPTIVQCLVSAGYSIVFVSADPFIILENEQAQQDAYYIHHNKDITQRDSLHIMIAVPSVPSNGLLLQIRKCKLEV